jgi:NAD(P)-dependent dehydrogenase (short-subunit alcohol dehydrogenase family)
MAGMSMKLLEGERALITGAAGGIGRGIAKALLAEGARVLGSDIVAPPAEDGIDFLAADLSKREGWRTLLNSAVNRLGTISLFVHAASPRRREADTPLSVSEETWEAMVGINLRSGFFLAREIGRHMREQQIKGRMLLITSMHREIPRNLVHYSASKAGMTMVMKELARVLAPDGIRVNAIAPGLTSTEFLKSRNDMGEVLMLMAKSRALPREEVPEDLVGACIFFASPDSDFITGQTLVVDGGQVKH